MNNQENFIFRCPRCNEVMVVVEKKPFIPVVWIAKRERYKGDIAICRGCKFMVSGSVLNFHFSEWLKRNNLFTDSFI